MCNVDTGCLYFDKFRNIYDAILDLALKKLPKGAEVASAGFLIRFPNCQENKCMHTTCQAPVSWIPNYLLNLSEHKSYCNMQIRC